MSQWADVQAVKCGASRGAIGTASVHGKRLPQKTAALALSISRCEWRQRCQLLMSLWFTACRSRWRRPTNGTDAQARHMHSKQVCHRRRQFISNRAAAGNSSPAESIGSCEWQHNFQL
jgi:hypothetical protein